MTIEAQGEALLVRFAGEEGRAHRCHLELASGRSAVGGRDRRRTVYRADAADPQRLRLSHQGVSVAARVFTRREAELVALMPKKKNADTSKILLCPMPGLVKTIDVAEGQEVKAGDALCMVEAMKMENVLRAERDVTVKKMLAKAGDSLAVDAVIMEFA